MFFVALACSTLLSAALGEPVRDLLVGLCGLKIRPAILLVPFGDGDMREFVPRLGTHIIHLDGDRLLRSQVVITVMVAADWASEPTEAGTDPAVAAPALEQAQWAVIDLALRHLRLRHDLIAFHSMHRHSARRARHGVLCGVLLVLCGIVIQRAKPFTLAC